MSEIMESPSTASISSRISNSSQNFNLSGTPTFSFTGSLTTSQERPIDENTLLLDSDYALKDSETLQIYDVPKANFLQTTFNAVNSLLGVGILSLPFAFKASGWIMGGLLLLVLLLITNYTAKVLRYNMLKPGVTSYPSMGEAAFSKVGRLFISTVFFFELFTACSMYLILAGDHLALLFPKIETWKFILICLAIVLPTASTSKLHYLSYSSLLGIFSSFWVLFVVIFEGFQENSASFAHPEKTVLYTNFEDSMITYGLAMVGFAGHAVLPSLYQSMKNPRQYNGMVDLTWAVLGTIYGSIAVCGYYIYGEKCADEITKNIFASNGGVVSQITCWLIIMNPLTKFALTLNPVALSLEELLEEKYFEHQNGLRKSLLFIFNRWILASITAAIAILVPNFGRVVGFIGSVFSFAVSVVFPCVCYLKLYKKELSYPVIILNVIIIGLAVYMAVLGTIGTIFS